MLDFRVPGRSRDSWTFLTVQFRVPARVPFRSMIGIDLFAGAGGMSCGAVAAGVQIELAVESDRYAGDTYVRNHLGTAVHAADIRKLSNRQIRRIRRGTDGTIAFGGPPCRGFSYSNQRTRSSANPDNWLFLEFLRVVSVWQPDWVVFENVRGITDTEGGRVPGARSEYVDRERLCSYARDSQRR